MNKTLISSMLACLTLGAAMQTANAATMTFSGDIVNQKDVVTIGFSLAQDTTNVRVWTDSFMNATNFDPITALWNAGTGALIDENDDNSSIAPGQTYYDSGFSLASLAAGNYFFTVATYPNFAKGTNIADGFAFDSADPIPLSTWCQPASHCGMGTFWRVNLDGVDSAGVVDPSAVPLPASAPLLISGLGALGFATRRRKTAVN